MWVRAETKPATNNIISTLAPFLRECDAFKVLTHGDVGDVPVVQDDDDLVGVGESGDADHH